MANLGRLEAAQGIGFKGVNGVQEGNVDIGGERRRDRRYDLKLELRWKTIQRRQAPESGVSHTLDLSSGGVRFTAGSDLPMGTNIALSVVWPALLNDVVPMLLAIQGKVVRSGNGWAAVRILQYEFRIQGIPREPRDGPEVKNSHATLPWRQSARARQAGIR